MHRFSVDETSSHAKGSSRTPAAHPPEVVTVPFGEPFLPSLVDWLMSHESMHRDRDWRRVALIFGGKRPGLYVRRLMAERIKDVFWPPVCFSQESWIRWLAGLPADEEPTWPFDLAYCLYRTAREATPALVRGREGFAAFYPWCRELLGFFDRLDFEQVSTDQLKTIEDLARLGWDVPDQVNRLLQQVRSLKRAFDRTLARDNLWPRGRVARRALERLLSQDTLPFERVVWAQPFSLTRIEEGIIRSLAERDRAVLFVQGDQDHWPMLQVLSDQLGVRIKEPPHASSVELNPRMIAASNRHAMAVALRTVVEQIPPDEREKTVVVVPDSAQVTTYLSALSDCGTELNVSMGYPLENSGLLTLLALMIETQNLRRDDEYPATNYLRVLQHPLIKTLRWQSRPATASRILVHKIEEWLKGWRASEKDQPKTTDRRLTGLGQAGRLFVPLHLMESSVEILQWAEEEYQREEPASVSPDWRRMIQEFHDVLFRDWERVRCMQDLGRSLKGWVGFLEPSQALVGYPLNLLAAERILRLAEEFEMCACAQERFDTQDLFRLLLQRLSSEKVAFRGTPLKGLQVLGLFETRALDFQRVIVMDAQEGILPTPARVEPLVPREVKRLLGLETIEMQEIQRYQWMRLLAGAKESVVIYLKDDQHERSRFLEEVIWWRQKKGLPCRPEETAVLAADLKTVVRRAVKTDAILDALRTRAFSPTALDVYTADPWEFYLRYVLDRRPLESAVSDVEARHIGDVIHKTLYEMFLPFVRKGTVPAIDRRFINKAGDVLDKHFQETFGESKSAAVYLLKRVMDERMKRFWRVERERLKGVRRIVALEQELQARVRLPSGRSVFLKGRIDRVDELSDGTMMVLDYKTGTGAKTPVRRWMSEALPDRETLHKRIRSWQLPVYYLLAKQHFPSEYITTALYPIRQTDALKLNILPGTEMGADFMRVGPDDVAATVLKALDTLFSELFDPGIPFEQTLGPMEGMPEE